MKRAHFDVEEDGFYGTYWACKDTHTAAGTDSTETVPAAVCYIILSNVCSIIAYYNGIAFAFTELYGRSYGGGVLEILPKEVGNIHVLNTGLLNINAELKRNVISVIDGVVRNGRNIDEALDYIDAKILVGILS